MPIGLSAQFVFCGGATILQIGKGQGTAPPKVIDRSDLTSSRPGLVTGRKWSSRTTASS
jgi:hypothetical protein